ncbi:MAG: anaerobic carbon-monoxide dehydrogenase catalytic subunit [Chloroflexi bacterium]|nr:anaerobic carbon-monoxide dehydrogenase catalytic subunit [Chloroflexota bacterium]
MEKRRTVDPSVMEMLERAREQQISTPFDRAEVTKPCPIGREGACCKHCFMGPCRLVGKTTVGICGATIDTITARNLTRAIAGGAAAHSDHGRSIAQTLLAVAEGKAPGLEIKDETKLRRVAGYLGVEVGERSKEDIARDVANVALSDFGRQEGELVNLKRAPPKRQEIWRKLGIAPRGIDREIAEAMHRTCMGCDQDYEHLLMHALTCSLTDGWGGSMLGTDISDILFGTPAPIASTSNFGVIRPDEVNIIIHGHEPTLAELIVAVVSDPEMLDYARSKGAKGINIMGMCCSGNELLLRHGVPIAGNFLQQELTIATGAIEAMVVDYQCVMQAIQAAAERTHTRIITTSPKVKITGATHIPFEEHHGMDIAKQIVRMAIDNYPNRKGVHIPDFMDRMVVGFSHEYIAYMQGGVYRQSFRPLNDAVIAGRIRGAAAIVGCNNPGTTHDEGHINLVKELIKNDVLVVSTGCAAVAYAKHGLLTPEVMEYAGPGLKEVCQAIGIPPVLHMGSCIDNSRILTVLTQMATEGGLGEDISDLPAVGIAPEWMSEKALTIGAYAVASGCYVLFGVGSPVKASAAVTEFLSKGWEAKVGGKLEFEPDWRKILEKSLAHIDAKRKALKIADYDPARFAKSESYAPADYLDYKNFDEGLYTVKAGSK